MVILEMPMVWLTFPAGLAALGKVTVCAAVLAVKNAAASKTPVKSTDFTFIILGLVVNLKTQACTLIIFWRAKQLVR